MPYGYGRGWGFGFRGMSPPWPYVGLGRGGLPRCGYYLSGVAWDPLRYYPSAQTGYPYYTGPWSTGPDEEIKYLKEQAEMLKRQLEEIEKRIKEIRNETSGKN